MKTKSNLCNRSWYHVCCIILLAICKGLECLRLWNSSAWSVPIFSTKNIRCEINRTATCVTPEYMFVSIVGEDECFGNSIKTLTLVTNFRSGAVINIILTVACSGLEDLYCALDIPKDFILCFHLCFYRCCFPYPSSPSSFYYYHYHHHHHRHRHYRLRYHYYCYWYRDAFIWQYHLLLNNYTANIFHVIDEMKILMIEWFELHPKNEVDTIGP